ncbi:MAG TPA: hypothetical protein VFT97_08330 [Candidatus Eisenbacteria bacterium]|nr:hypothetical protein [Candidatus Eisenbacteria bacterium]
MKQSLLIPAFVLTIALAGWELAYAQAPDTTGAAPGTPGTTTSTTTTTTTTPTGDASSTTTTTTSTPAATPPSAAYLAARERGKGVAAKETATIDKDLTTVAKGVDGKAAKDGDATVAGRLASDFGVSSDALLAEKAKYNVGWGDLMIAHTLGANTLTGVTVDEILVMRTTDAMGWGGIASGLDLKLGSVVSGVKSEAKVAMGGSRADGKPAKIAVAEVAPTGSSSSSGGTGSTGMSPSGDAGTAGK